MIMYSALLSAGIIATSLIQVFAIPDENIFIPKISSIDNFQNPTIISGELTPKSKELPETIVEKYYNENLSYTNNNKAKQLSKTETKEFKVLKKGKHSLGRTVVKTIQTYKGVPIFGTQQNFNVSDDGVIELIVGSSVENIESKIAFPISSIKISQQDVLNAIEKHLGFKPEYNLKPKFELELYPVKDKYVYCYKVNISYDKPSYGGNTYYVHTNDLSILNTFNLVADARYSTTGTGLGQLFGTETKSLPLNMVFDDQTGNYYLEDLNLNYKTVKYDTQQIYSEPDNFFNSDDGTNFQEDAVDAHYNVLNAIKFYKEILGRNGNDDCGSPYLVQLDTNDPTYNGHGGVNQMMISTGHGQRVRSAACSLDVIGHEYTHGVLLSEGLTYQNNGEDGALQEGLSDVFGTLCEYYYYDTHDISEVRPGTVFDWAHSEDTYNLGVQEPDFSSPTGNEYAQYKAQPTEAHAAREIPQIAAYLIARGGNHPNGRPIIPIAADEKTAITKLTTIFYDVVYNNLLTNMKFRQFAESAVFAASKAYGAGSSEVQTVKDAFSAIGILPDSIGPQNFIKTSCNNFNVEFTWDGTPGASYALFRKTTESTGIAERITEPTTNTTATVETLPGSYDFYVSKVDTEGNRISDFSSGITVITDYVAAPGNFVMTNHDNLDVQFSWDSTPGATYAIYRNTTGDVSHPELVGTTTDNTFTTETLPGSCDFYIARVNAEGNRLSEFSSVATVVFNYFTAPDNFLQAPSNGYNIQFSWNSKPGALYAIYRKVTGSSDLPVRITDPTTGATVTAKTLYGSCDFYVAEVDSQGRRISDFSNVIAIEKLNYISAPQNFKLTSCTGQGVSFVWDGDSTSGFMYGLYRRIPGSTDEFYKVGQTSNTYYGYYALNKEFDYCVAIVDDSGNRISEYSNVYTVPVWQAAPASDNVYQNGNAVTISWRDNSAGEPYTGYYAIYRKIAGSTDNPVKIGELTTAKTATVETLPGSYNFQIVKVDPQGIMISNFSQAITINYYAAPANFEMYKVNSNLVFYWDITGDEIYRVYRKLSGSSDAPVMVSQVNTGLSIIPTISGSYDYFVARFDSNGNRISEFSNVITVES